MNKWFSVLLIALLSASVASADAKTGQKVYLKTLKAKFNMNGTKFAAEHTVSEWEELFADGAKGFIKEYGSDSGNVPSCG